MHFELLFIVKDRPVGIDEPIRVSSSLEYRGIWLSYAYAYTYDYTYD